jgi:heme-degrading monooxygenase HmoA
MPRYGPALLITGLLGSSPLMPAADAPLNRNAAAPHAPNDASLALNRDNAAIWAINFVHARPGQRERLERFLKANWLPIDALARQHGYIRDFRLLRADEAARATWDYAVVIEYENRQAMTDFVPRYVELARQRPYVRIDGLSFADLGEVAFQNVAEPIATARE